VPSARKAVKQCRLPVIRRVRRSAPGGRLWRKQSREIFVKYGFRSVNPDVTASPGRKPLGAIKLLFTDPREQEKAAEEIKKRYAQYFGI